MKKEKINKITQIVKDKIAKSDIMRRSDKFDRFTSEERKFLKETLEDAWSRGRMKDKNMCRVMLKMLDSAIGDEK